MELSKGRLLIDVEQDLGVARRCSMLILNPQWRQGAGISGAVMVTDFAMRRDRLRTPHAAICATEARQVLWDNRVALR